jgi:hypothetical protein
VGEEERGSWLQQHKNTGESIITALQGLKDERFGNGGSSWMSFMGGAKVAMFHCTQYVIADV